ncbi:methyltransferase domain-containing protein [Tepidiphilus baoligensis]|uniref:Methyltransferase domain-containing protein n=2 Tax=Tepidiphilus baoligensis TaxID=2698687 RepID=A0ABX1QL15_9PROT|nr:methyltransferase domain-containing protein [Tepidiphilus baoligensis]
MDRSEWLANIKSEIDFWSRWMETGGLSWPDDFVYRTDPNSEAVGLFRKYLEMVSAYPPRVLDVGAGPLTILGKKINGQSINLTAVDALAEFYDQLPFPAGSPIVRTEKCETECLSEKFPENYFDITHAQNTLDHHYNPIAAILEMIKVTKRSGFIITSHAENEATRENWSGLHQWNFFIENNDLIISNKEKAFSVSSLINRDAEIVEIFLTEQRWVNCVIRKI